MNTTCRVERLDVLCLEKLWSSVCHRLRRSVSEVGAVFILDVDVKRYLRVGTLLHFIWVSIIEMRTSCFFCFFWDTDAKLQSKQSSLKTLRSWPILEKSQTTMFYTVAKTSSSLNGLYEPDYPLWEISLCYIPNEHYLMTHIQKGRHGK